MTIFKVIATVETLFQSRFQRACHPVREFTEIFDNSKNLGEGTLKLVNWLLKANSFFPKTVRTIINWFGEIVGYFEKRTTNAVVEGINNRLKVLKRCGFGFRNVNNFNNRALLFWHLTDSLAW